MHAGARGAVTKGSRPSDVTRRVDFAPFMVEARENDELVHEASAIVGRQTPSVLAHAASE